MRYNHGQSHTRFCTLGHPQLDMQRDNTVLLVLTMISLMFRPKTEKWWIEPVMYLYIIWYTTVQRYPVDTATQRCHDTGICNRCVRAFRTNNQDRNNGFKLEKLRFRRETGRYWFSSGVVDEWNELANHIVSAETMRIIKRLQKFMDGDDRWNCATDVTQGLPEVDLTALIFLCSYVLIR